MTKTVTTKQGRLLAYLQRGLSVSATSAATMFGVANLSATVNDLRRAGHNVTWFTGRGGVTRYYLA
jgi:hypothetical protein